MKLVAVSRVQLSSSLVLYLGYVRMLLTECQRPITRSLHLPYKPYETSFARIFLFLETAGLLDSRALCAIQYNITQHNTIQCTSYTIRFLGNLRLAWGENYYKNRKIREKVDSRIWEMEAPCDGLLRMFIFI